MANRHTIGNNTRTRLMAMAIMALAGTCASAQTTPTAFSYQGSLRGTEGVATGPHDFVFRLMSDVEGGTQVGPELCADNVEVAAGVFTVQLDFGSVFTQAPLYLEVSVRPDQGLDCSDIGSMTSLAPRQPISASPRAIHAATAGNAASIGGQPASNIALLNSGQTFSGPASFINPSNIFAGNGAGLTQLNASSLLFGSIPGARMPLDWAAGGDLTGLYPSPRLVAGAVARRHLSPELSSVLSQLTMATSPQTPVAWGLAQNQQLLIPALPAGVTYTKFAAGFFFSLGIRSDGQLRAWGINNAGQCNVPALAPGLTYVSAAGGHNFTVAVLSNGTISGWGLNTEGQLNVPALPPGITYTQVAAGRAHVVALRSDGSMVAWGSNQVGESQVPVLPPGVVIIDIAANSGHSLAVRSDGLVAAWGENANGQTNVPALPQGVTYKKVAAGFASSLAIRSDGSLVGWGDNSVNQISVPALPAGVAYTAVSAGAGHAVALRDDGVIVAFGDSSDGQTAVPVLPAGTLYAGIAAGGFHSLAQRVSPIGLNAATLSGSGSGLTNLNASNFTQGVLPVAQVPGLDASKIISGVLSPAIVPGLDTSKIVSGTLPNARTTATSAATASTLVARDASGGFAAGVITGTLAGNAASASNASALGGQPPAFYTNASNITSGILAAAQVPGLDASKIVSGALADARLSSNIPRLNTSNSFTGTQHFFAGQVNVNCTPGPTELCVGGRLTVNQGVIQKGGAAVTGTTDLGLYSQLSGEYMRFVTTNAPFFWYSDSGQGLNPRMSLSPQGNLSITGSMAKAGGSFKIDHPLDPANKYLYHSFVESPDMMNIYNGNVTTDAQGFATITLPDYFEALNQDFRYQLTVVDADNASDEFILVKVTEKVKDNRFSIRASKGNSEVSWQVTGVRHDAWAQQNRIPNAVEKVGQEKGRYLHPEAFGKSAADGMSTPAPAASN